jgi:DNA polymerase elongation subunit (family B)
MTGNIELRDLVVSKFLGQGLDKYKLLDTHVSAAIQLAIKGKSTPVGEGVEYVFTNARHTNPLNRVMPIELIKDRRQDLEYDKEKYL